MTTIRRAGVVGWPVAHSRSPVIHGAWLEEHGIAGSYERLPVPPEEIDTFLARLPERGLVGVNVTIPHKEAAFRAVAEVDDVARRLGVVNTIWLENGRLRGANTDVPGFLANLDAEAPGWDAAPGPAVVLGAGGAARAVVDGLAARGFAPRIVNRTLGRAEALAAGYPGATAHGFADLPRLLGETGLLVNTTSLGMAGQPPLEIDLAPLAETALVTDIVYVPLETPLLALARARRLRTVDGLGMLLHQAVPGFERWFGVRPRVTPALRAAVLETF
jgi:shikimate dehydrogenase